MAYSRRNRLGRLIWQGVYLAVFRISPRPLHQWRRLVLRIFGAKLEGGVNVYAAARIWAPWNLECHTNACIADGAEIYNPARVLIRRSAIVSQGAFLCAATHDYRLPEFPLREAPIEVGERAWIGARAIILPGVTVGDGSVIGAGSVVSRSVPAFKLCVGNPAQIVRDIEHERPG